MLNGFIAVYRPNLDVVIYVLGTAQQNELMLSCVLDTIYEVFSEILKYLYSHEHAHLIYYLGPKWTCSHCSSPMSRLF